MKVFCIGLSKTGTRSLHDALGILGLRSVHWGGPDLASAVQRGPEIRAAVERALAEGRPLLDDLEEADAYSDIEALSHSFDVLDRQYPGSRFILTVRPLDEWLRSRRQHVEANQAMRARGEYDGTFLEVDLEGWRAEAIAHEARVRAHFAARPDDLLVMDISAGDGWELLCPFLGVPVPDVPFPRRGERGGR
jgi:hypothetical protein